ncbi:MAG: motility protein A [Fidelibacterota bacterium]
MNNKRVDFGTAIGLVAGLAIIGLGALRGGGELYWFFNLNSIFIVLGGTLAATMVNYPLKQVKNLANVLKQVFEEDSVSYNEMIERIVELGEKARKKGLLSLEPELAQIEDKYLRDGVELAITEKDPVRLRQYLKLELANMERRHSIGQEIFFYMGSYAPAFGMLGTVMGLIVMMNNFSGGPTSLELIEFDVAKKFADLLGGMALALITTFYGVLLSNLVFLPIGGKLKRKSDEEIMLKLIVMEGIISLHKKDHPIVIRDKLMTFVPTTLRKEVY